MARLQKPKPSLCLMCFNDTFAFEQCIESVCCFRKLSEIPFSRDDNVRD
jgi:hypothetical protein